MSDLDLIDPGVAQYIEIGEGPLAYRAAVRPLKLGKLPAFARALQPIADDVQQIAAGGVTAGAVLDLLANHFDQILEVLQVATDAPAESLRDATVEQALELVLAVVGANKDFLRGRMAAALRTAAQANRGAGPTPSSA